MTLRNSFAGLPAFLFGDGGLHNQLVCDVRTFVRAVDGDGRTLLAPMLAWSPGPPAIGDTGDNSPGHMMGTTWLLQVCPDGSWVLYREERGRLEVMPFDDPPDPVTATARHVSLCFDQAARVALAWEDQGVIKVRRWDAEQNQYIENVSFAGVDPVVVFDATWRYRVPDSDVLLFYLSPDRERVLCRVQRDVYAVEHEIWESGHWEDDPDPQTESQVTSTTTGSAYPSYYSEATIHEDGRLTHVRIDASSAGAWSLSVEPAGGGPALAGASASGGPGVIEFALTEPLPVSAATAYRFVFTPPTSAQVRYNTAAWSGALWSASTLFFVGFGVFNGSPPMGLTVDVGEAVFVPGGPVILDRVIALPYKYQVLVADSTGTPLPSVLVSDLYPVALTTGVRLEPEFLEGEYRQVAYQYESSVGVQLVPEFIGGALTLPVTTYSPLVGVELSPEFHSGVLKDVVTQYAPAIGVELAPEFVTSALDDIGVPYAPSLGVELAPEFIGGVYEPG